MSRSDYKSLSKGYLDNTRSYGGHQIYTPNNAVENKSVENFNFDNGFISNLYKAGTRLRALIQRRMPPSSKITYKTMNIIIVKYDSGNNYKVKLDTGNQNSYQDGADHSFVGISLVGSNYVNFIRDLNDTSREYSIPYHSIIAKNPYTLYTNSPPMFGSLLTNYSSTGDTFSNVLLDDNLFLLLKGRNNCTVNVYISNSFISDIDYDRLYINNATYDLTKTINIGGETYQIKKDNNNRYYVEIKNNDYCTRCCNYVDDVFDAINNKMKQKLINPLPNNCQTNSCPLTKLRDIEKDKDCKYRTSNPIRIQNNCSRRGSNVRFFKYDIQELSNINMNGVCDATKAVGLPASTEEIKLCKSSLGL